MNHPMGGTAIQWPLCSGLLDRSLCLTLMAAMGPAGIGTRPGSRLQAEPRKTLAALLPGRARLAGSSVGLPCLSAPVSLTNHMLQRGIAAASITCHMQVPRKLLSPKPITVMGEGLCESKSAISSLRLSQPSPRPRPKPSPQSAASWLWQSFALPRLLCKPDRLCSPRLCFKP